MEFNLGFKGLKLYTKIWFLSQRQQYPIHTKHQSVNVV